MKKYENYINRLMTEAEFVFNQDDYTKDESQPDAEVKPTFENGYEQIPDPGIQFDDDEKDSIENDKVDYLLNKLRQTFLFTVDEFWCNPAAFGLNVKPSYDLSIGVPDKVLRVHLILEGEYDLNFGKITPEIIDQFMDVLGGVYKKNFKSKVKIEKLSSQEITMDNRDCDKIELYFDIYITSIDGGDLQKKQEWWEDRITIADNK